MQKPMWDSGIMIRLKKSAGAFFLSRIKNNNIYYNLRAETMRWDTSKKNWLLSNVVEHTNDGLKETAG